MEVVRSNLCPWGTQGRDLSLAFSLLDTLPGYHPPSTEGSPQTHKPSPVPAQKLMSAGWNWPQCGCGQGADKRSWFSSFPDNFHCLPCWNSWEGCSSKGSSIRSSSSSLGCSKQQKESGNSCISGSGWESSTGRVSLRAVPGILASPRATVTQLFHNTSNGFVSWGWSEACSYLVTSLNSSLAQWQIRLEEALKYWQICAYGLQDWPWLFRE